MSLGPRAREPWWQLWGLLLAGTLLSVFLQGFSLPNNGNAYHYPLVLDWIGSAEGPRDAFTQSLRFYVTHFWTVVGWLTTEATLPAVFLALHLGFRLLLILGLRLILLRLVAGPPWRATLAAAALPVLLSQQLASPLGGGEVLLDSLSHSTAIVSVILCAWGLALGGRWRWAALVLGLGFNIKGFMAVWAVLTLAGALLASRPAVEWRRNLAELLRLGALFALGALPTAIWILASWREMTLDAGGLLFDQRPFLLEFYPGHTMVWTHAPTSWLLGLLYAAGFLLLGGLGALRRAAPEGTAGRSFAGLWLASLAIVLLAVPLPLLTGNPALLNASPLRIDAFLVWLFAILLAARALTLPRLRPLLLLAALAVLAQAFSALFALLLLAQPAARRGRVLAALAGAALLLLWWDALPDGGVDRGRGFDLLVAGLLVAALPQLLPRKVARPDRLALLGWLAMLDYLAGHGLLASPGAAGAGALLLLAITLLRPDRLAQLAVAAALGLMLGLLALQGAAPRVLLLLAAGAALPPAWLRLLAFLPSPRLARPIAVAALLMLLAPPALHLLRTGHLDRYDERALAFLEAQRWARAHTPPDSLFLQPDEQLRPNLTPSFWTLSRRPAWVDWRMGAAVHWQPSFYPLWHQRMAEVAALPDVAAKLAYARAQGIPYLVLDAAEARPAGAPAPLYDDGFWVILPAN
jgi:hypothetical protein